MQYFFGIDIYYIILVVPCLIIALWAQFKVRRTFEKYQAVRSIRGLTGAQAAAEVLRQNGVSGVRIEQISGRLSDHYDPATNTIRLSDAVYASASVASIGIAAHEAGHAVQYASGYTPVRIRSAIVPVTRIGSVAAIPLLLVGMFFSRGWLIDIGLLAYSLSTVFQLVTLPVELDASSRALAAIESGGLLTAEEYPMAKQTLSAAAMTYVAALATSIVMLLRMLLLFGGHRGGGRRGR